MDDKIKNAKSTLKILGILSIVAGALAIVMGAMSLGGCEVLAGQMANSAVVGPTEAEAAATVTGLVLVAGAFVLISGVFTLLMGIFSVRAANDFSKIGPAYVFAIIDLVASVISAIVSLVGSMSISSLLGGAGGIAISACIFWAANTIKDYDTESVSS